MSDKGDCRTAPATPSLLKMGANQEKTGQSDSKQFKLEENWAQWDKTGQMGQNWSKWVNLVKRGKNGTKQVKTGPTESKHFKTGKIG